MKNGCDFIKEMSKAKKQKCYQRLRKIMSGRVSKIRRVEGKEKLKIGWSMREYWQERKGKWKIKRKKSTWKKCERELCQRKRKFEMKSN